MPGKCWGSAGEVLGEVLGRLGRWRRCWGGAEEVLGRCWGGAGEVLGRCLTNTVEEAAYAIQRNQNLNTSGLGFAIQLLDPRASQTFPATKTNTDFH